MDLFDKWFLIDNDKILMKEQLNRIKTYYFLIMESATI
jgi:hypothetical protein